MRTFLKVIALSTLGLLAACSGADDGGVAQGGAEDARGSDDPAPAPAGDGDREGEINTLVAGAGRLTTEQQADAEPVKKGEPETLEVPGENGTTMQCTQTPYSLTKVPEKFVALNPNADRRQLLQVRLPDVQPGELGLDPARLQQGQLGV